MEMNIHKLAEDAIKKIGTFTSITGLECEIILFDFDKPIKKRKPKNKYNGKRLTEYIYYNCTFLKLKRQENFQIKEIQIPQCKHIIQMAYKTCWFQLYTFLTEKNILKQKNIHLKIIWLDNYTYRFELYSTHNT